MEIAPFARRFFVLATLILLTPPPPRKPVRRAAVIPAFTPLSSPTHVGFSRYAHLRADLG
jgi:hypothetical protein